MIKRGIFYAVSMLYVTSMMVVFALAMQDMRAHFLEMPESLFGTIRNGAILTAIAFGILALLLPPLAWKKTDARRDKGER